MPDRFRVARAVWAVTTLFILLSTAAPFRFDLSLDSVSSHLSRIRLNPLISPDTGRRVSIPDFVANLLFFIPFGAATVSAFGGRRSVRPIVAAGLLGCALSVAVESIQLLTTNRVSSLADVLANTIGTLTGAITAAILRRREWQRLSNLAQTGIFTAPTYFPMLATALLVCIASWEPFDVTLDVSVVVGHLKALQAGLWHVSFSADHIISLVQFLLFGFMLTQWLREMHVRFSVIIGIGLAVTAGIALEASQIFIASRLPTFDDAVTNAAGGVAGALVNAVDAGVRSKLRALILVCLFAAGIATVQWMSGREAPSAALRDIGLSVVGAYVGAWSAGRTPRREQQSVG